MTRGYRIPELDAALTEKACIVVGSAPCPPITPKDERVYVAANGGICSTPRCDVWVLNARDTNDARDHPLYPLMVKQGAGKHVGLLVLFTWGGHGDPVAETLKRLTQQGTTWESYVEINHATRVEIEAKSGGRGGKMGKHALSCGLTAACLCFWAGAASVELCGFSFQNPAYAYATPRPITTRGHIPGDKEAIRRLATIYGSKFTHRLRLNDHVGMTEAEQAALRKAFMSPRKSTPVHPDPPPAYDGPLPRTVRATQDVWYGLGRRREGDVFRLANPSDFMKHCMVDVPPDAGDVRPTPKELQTRANEIARDMAGRRQTPQTLGPVNVNPGGHGFTAGDVL
jgi:hypothetical protein